VKISIVVGTRPELVKMSPIIHECESLGLDFFILHTGQHYSYSMDKVFFEQLELPEARYNLDVGSGSHAEQTGKMLVGVEKVLLREESDIVLVEGDTNSVVAGALAAAKLGVKVGHVEAGLRSYDREMPEELNRIIADHISDLLFAPTEKSKKVLLDEGIPGEKIYMTGNTVVDAVYQNLKMSKRKTAVLSRLGLKEQGFFLATVHRQENVDDRDRFRGILKGLEMVEEKLGLPVIYPMHPRAKKQMEVYGFRLKGVNLIDPLDYLSFLRLESEARVVLTDSGGVQEETCILGVPCVTLRDNTERPETLEAGSNVLAGTNPHEIVQKTQMMLSKRRDWIHPFGDGEAGKEIVDIIRRTVTR
jgi:UDP-N-acetylglucosamine 2-epimerase (non-hydrolysing)